MEKENVNRRDFLKTSLKTIAVGSLALSSIDIKRLLAQADSTLEAAKVISLSDYPELGNVGGYADIGGKTIVFRTGDTKFLALSKVCTHKKCEVEYNGTEFECPCHGSKYSKTGKVLNGPATKNLKSYKTTYNADDNTLSIG